MKFPISCEDLAFQRAVAGSLSLISNRRRMCAWRTCTFRSMITCAWLIHGCAALAPRDEFRAEVSYSQQGVPHGSYRLYNSLGALQGSGQFDNGRRVGLWVFWDSGGTKAIELSYVDSTKEGPCQMWFGSFAMPSSAGQKKLEVHFANGLQDGKKRTWWANGRPKCDTELKAGAVTAARCWTPEGEPVPFADASRAARSELEADAKYLTAVDEIVEESLRPVDDGRVP